LFSNNQFEMKGYIVRAIAIPKSRNTIKPLTMPLLFIYPASFFKKLSLFLFGLLCYKNHTANSSCTSGKCEQDSSVSTSLRKQEVLIVDYIQNNCCICRCLLFCAFAFCI